MGAVHADDPIRLAELLAALSLATDLGLGRPLEHARDRGALTIAEKTASHHVEHIYAKIGVSTRVGAALFAMQHDLV